jgi:hypothetical protein
MGHILCIQSSRERETCPGVAGARAFAVRYTAIPNPHVRQPLLRTLLLGPCPPVRQAPVADPTLSRANNHSAPVPARPSAPCPRMRTQVLMQVVAATTRRQRQKTVCPQEGGVGPFHAISFKGQDALVLPNRIAVEWEARGPSDVNPCDSIFNTTGSIGRSSDACV